MPVWDGATRRYVWVKLSGQDYALGLSRRWSLDKGGYPAWHYFDVKLGKSVMVYLHRLVARAPAGVLVDHKHGDKLDARRSQLRRATPSQNSANRRLRLATKSSRFKGVTRHPCGRWQAQCKHRDVNRYLGLHATEEAAALAYNREASRHWGEFATLNRVPSPVTAQGRAA